MKVLAIIPARGQSKGIPRKNLALCAGKPLLQWTVEAAKESKLLTGIAVSSDSFEIVSLAHQLGALGHPRVEELAQDDTPTEPVIDAVLKWMREDYDAFVLLQPTSPVRTGAQIDEAVSMIGEYDSVLSVVPFHGFIWVDQLEPDRARIQRPFPPPAWGARPRRQDFFPSFLENGSIYVSTLAQWRRTGNRIGGRVGLYEMPQECGVEVDSPFDLWLAEKILEKHR